MSKRNNRQKKPKQSEGRSESLVLSVLKSRPVLGLRIILEILGVVMTALFFYPKFSVAPSSAWDSSNPIQSTFIIKNDSNLGCYNVTSDYGSNISIHSDAVLGAPVSLIPNLCPNESSTVSIEKIITTSPNAIDDADVVMIFSIETVELSLGQR